jgi:hypothetical protein
VTATDATSHRDRCAITGIGNTAYSRDSGVSDLTLTGAVLVAGHERPAEWTFLATYAIGATPAAAVGLLAWRAERAGAPASCL